MTTPELILHEFNQDYYVRHIKVAETQGAAPAMRELFLNVVKFDLAQLYESVEEARKHGIRCSVLIPVNGKPTLQVEE